MNLTWLRLCRDWSKTLCKFVDLFFLSFSTVNKCDERKKHVGHKHTLRATQVVRPVTTAFRDSRLKCFEPQHKDSITSFRDSSSTIIYSAPNKFRDWPWKTLLKQDIWIFFYSKYFTSFKRRFEYIDGASSYSNIGRVSELICRSVYIRVFHKKKFFVCPRPYRDNWFL